MRKENFVFDEIKNYVPKTLFLKWNQNTTGKYDGTYFTSTMTKLTLKNGQIEHTVGVKNEKDFDFETLFNLAYPTFAKMLKDKFDSDERDFKINYRKEKKERKRPQY